MCLSFWCNLKYNVCGCKPNIKKKTRECIGMDKTAALVIILGNKPHRF